MCDGGSGGSGGSEGDVADAAVAAAEAMSDMAGVAEAQAAEQAANAAGIGMGAAADLGGAVAAGASPADVAGAFGSGMSTNAMAENMAAGMGITGLDAMIGNIGRAYGLPPNPANANLAQAGLMATVPGMGLLGLPWAWPAARPAWGRSSAATAPPGPRARSARGRFRPGDGRFRRDATGRAAGPGADRDHGGDGPDRRLPVEDAGVRPGHPGYGSAGDGTEHPGLPPELRPAERRIPHSQPHL